MAAARIKLRDYLYIDRLKAEGFLAQVAGGVTEKSMHKKTEGGAQATGTLSVMGIGKVGGTIKDPSMEQESSMRHDEVSTVEALLSPPADHLLRVATLDDIEWNDELRDGLLEVRGELRLSGMAKVVQLMGTMGRFMDLSGMMAAEVGEGAEAEAAVQLMLTMGNDTGLVPIRVSLDGTDVLAGELNAECLRVPRGLTQLEGDVSILCRVDRVVPEGEEVVLLPTFASLASMGIDIHEFASSLDDVGVTDGIDLNVSSRDMVLPGPVLQVSVVAVYR